MRHADMPALRYLPRLTGIFTVNQNKGKKIYNNRCLDLEGRIFAELSRINS